jgi:uncharacterized membrane protein YccC
MRAEAHGTDPEARAVPGPPPSLAACRRFRPALRVGLGVAFAFVLAHALEWPLAMLTPVLTVQLLAALRGPPSLKMGSGIVAIVIGASATGYLISQLVIYPAVVVLLIGTGLFAIFFAQVRGRGGPAAFIFLIAITLLPVMAVKTSADAVALVAFELIRASFAAVLIAWFAFALIPDVQREGRPPSPPPANPPATPTAGTRPPVPPSALGPALLSTSVILPLVVAYLLFDLPSGPAALVTALSIIGRADQPRVLGGLVVGNVLAGIGASLGYLMILAAPSLMMIFLVVLLLALLCGDHASSGRPTAPLAVVALVSIVLFLDAGLSVLSEGTTAAFFSRLFDIGFAIAYVIAAVAVLQPLRTAA